MGVLDNIKFKHLDFRNDEFWKKIPAWNNVTKDEFSDYKWQNKNSITKIKHIKEKLQNKISDELFQDIQDGQKITPMNIRITPYVFSLIDWDNPVDDPLRKQFLPLGSQFLPDHPMHLADSLNEDGDSPVEMLTHRYPDKVLFLPITMCPVYCSYCTRSRIIGGSTESIQKATYGANKSKWDKVFDYIKANSEIEDVVISGGDAYMLTADQIKYIGESLLKIHNVRRIRFATKGIAIFPQKILTDDAWFRAMLAVDKFAKKIHKSSVIHTHFSSHKEITDFTRKAMIKLREENITVRNQAVLQAGVNDTPEDMIHLTRQLGYMNIQPYYVYQHDMVPGCEHLRTTLREAIELEKMVRGTTAGFNTPTFVCDLPNGGGKRHVSSYEYYDEEHGISVWKAPLVKGNEKFLYFDPIHKLSKDAQARMLDKEERDKLIASALNKVS